MPCEPYAEAESLSAALRRLAPEPVDPSPVIRTRLPFHGVSLGSLEGLAKAGHRAHPGASPALVLALADALWPEAVREEMVLATMLAGKRGDRAAAIPKAISWVLREHTRHCPGAAAAFREEHAAELPAVAVREARHKLATGHKGGRRRDRTPAG